MMRPMLSCVVALGVVLGLSVAAQARIPGATNPATETYANSRADVLAYNQKTLTGAYQSVGQHGAWDDAAVAFLNDVAQMWSYDGGRWAESSTKAPAVTDVLAKGKTALDAGCKDPLVRYCYGRVLETAGRDAEARSYLHDAYEDMITSDYPAVRVFSAAQHAEDLVSQREHGLWEQTLVDAAVDACRQPKDDAVSRTQAEVGLELVLGVLEQRAKNGTGDLKLLKQVVGELQKNRDAWPYATDCLAGMLEIQEGWKDRGSGWASTVTQAGWRSLATHGAAARKDFETAWKLDPHQPYAPTYMINVVLMNPQGHDPRVELRQWFERATLADLEYGPAWNSYFWALRPRWFGNEHLMLNLGMEALNTGRFDTGIPAQYLTALKNIAEDEGSPRVWGLESVGANLNRLADGYLKVLTAPEARRYLLSLKVATAVEQREWEQAYALFETLPAHTIDPAVPGMMMLPASDLADEIVALGGPDHAALDKAAGEAREGDQTAARQDFQEALKTLKPGSVAARYAERQVAALQQEGKLHGGAWVTIQPGADLAGWTVAAGTWQVKGGTLVGTSDARGLALVYDADVGPRYEISGHIDVVHTGEEEPRVGPLVPYLSLKRFYVMDLRGVAHHFGLLTAQYEGWDRAGQVTGHDDFDVIDYDGEYAAMINGKPAFSHTRLPDNARPTGARIGIGGVKTGVGLTIEVSQLKVRELKAAPATSGAKFP